ncbi:Glutathione S-transferase Z1 [Capsicum annuum]|nr:Glutathione S-transferase Z1 [Capsicum annuum]
MKNSKLLWPESKAVTSIEVEKELESQLFVAGSGEESKKMKLYSYWRSSCAFRVRIALNLKGLEYEYKAVDLLKGEQTDPEYLKLNPLGYVPTLVDGDAVIADSFAIIMYLEEKYPLQALLPQDCQKRAINYQAANIVSANIQPLQNLVILRSAFAALEKLLKDYAGKYATGDEVYMADLFLAPQIYAAINRFEVDMNQFPTLLRVYKAYQELPAFQDAMPEKQPDATS